MAEEIEKTENAELDAKLLAVKTGIEKQEADLISEIDALRIEGGIDEKELSEKYIRKIADIKARYNGIKSQAKSAAEKGKEYKQDADTTAKLKDLRDEAIDELVEIVEKKEEAAKEAAAEAEKEKAKAKTVADEKKGDDTTGDEPEPEKKKAPEAKKKETEQEPEAKEGDEGFMKMCGF